MEFFCLSIHLYPNTHDYTRTEDRRKFVLVRKIFISKTKNYFDLKHSDEKYRKLEKIELLCPKTVVVNESKLYNKLHLTAKFQLSSLNG